MIPLPQLDRPNLSHGVARTIRQLVISGELPAGTRVNELQLSRQLGVSRTPVRESLSLLSAEGFLRAEPRRGFFVATLTAGEVEQLYPIRALLDPPALGLAGIPDPERLTDLGRINLEIAAISARSPVDPVKIVDLDDEWHRLLVAGCPNRILLGLIDQLILKSRRYELAYMSETGSIAIATEEHDRILRHLEQNELDLACESLAENMSSAREPLVRWLEQRESGNR